MSRSRPARVPAAVLSGRQVEDLPYGTAVSFAHPSHRGPRVRGRLVAVIGADLTFDTCAPERSVTVSRDHVTDARVVPAVLSDGDAVLRRGVSAEDWRGGVIRIRGTQVLVETLDTIEWMDEADLIRADLVVSARPPARRGRPRADRTAADAADVAAMTGG